MLCSQREADLPLFLHKQISGFSHRENICKLKPDNSENQNQNSLLVKPQNDNTSPGLGRGRLVPRSHKGSKFRYAAVRKFSRGDERIREDIPSPDSLGKEAFSCRHLY